MTTEESAWNSMDTEPEEGWYLALLESELLGGRCAVVHKTTAKNGKTIRFVGGRFSYNAPDIIAWTPLPDIPEGM